ncbi:putative gamma-glutamylcyclotransferase CG2811 isoform X2 [Agrilus planipennis]|uniref:Gamma-glutamylcyclotransferase family protein n=1 Tax=Agrilus planipennis TaxID=224129 RepID=A0A1W4W7U8_AGRPL|nr:putative gamma-glutamylcyclotransferase CG2811 isoform X2 [Agrilus planipennis]
MSQITKVFVYGTLKKGEPNHGWFSKDESGYHKFLCTAETTEKYPLIIATKYNIPFILHAPGNGFFIKGEVYEVDEKVLKNLDILEEHPDYYEREKRNVRSLNGDDEIMNVWIYFIKRFKPELLNNPMYDNYSSNGSHGLEYVSSEQSTLEDLN